VVAGWSDSYNVGIPCQWVDISDVWSSNTTLTIHVNPKDWLCEGTRQVDAEGDYLWTFTDNYTTNPPYPAAGLPIDKPTCIPSPGAYDNNIDHVEVYIPGKGEGYLTSNCNEHGQTFGPKRNCEMKLLLPQAPCEPGAPVELICRIDGDVASPVPQVVRVCEYSIVLGSGIPCRYNDEGFVSNGILLPNTVLFMEFTCPTYRDRVERGGFFTLYSGALFNYIDPLQNVSCFTRDEFFGGSPGLGFSLSACFGLLFLWAMK